MMHLDHAQTRQASRQQLGTCKPSKPRGQLPSSSVRRPLQDCETKLTFQAFSPLKLLLGTRLAKCQSSCKAACNPQGCCIVVLWNSLKQPTALQRDREKPYTPLGL